MLHQPFFALTAYCLLVQAKLFTVTAGKESYQLTITNALTFQPVLHEK